ncbi:hypothetical protein RF679_07065 [Undibacterium cyanobacteriorum]|uniref:Uncharacterized protein n=1 Tax=Undibacterium cyanobacteriorum TaxID=3073561 RepID=A0ABY9RLF2_9BURK|nr:hypothetical protein [Undibacterium sp. 20NA77.5]WMW82040.1 hypothetical protein RF679_07065 [Undibacterium sp. 20NA77.5]
MDKRALKILFDSYWSPQGWKPDAKRGPSSEDFAYAKSKRLMFDPIELNHDRILKQLSNSIERLNRRKVADAFLASLSTRRLDWRSALGSYAVFQHLPPHTAQINEHRCSVCGVYLHEHTADLNVLNFERFKWGGVRHTQVIYAAFDLGLLLESPIPTPTAEDIQLFRTMLSAINAAPSNLTSAALQSHFAKVLKSNKAERDVIVAILGFCGILGTHAHPGFSDAFVPSDKRDIPDRHFVDMPYPACWWRGDAGINQTKLEEYFGHVL